jgi:hypothetical protein
MKRIITICAAILMTASVFAQAPNKMSYQAVVRDGSNNLVASTAVGVRISILQGTSSGSAVYVETQTPSTNANGLVSLEIGAGTVVSGMFDTIDWANGPYFIKTETDPTGGTNYTITGTSQLLSVPYALYSKLGGFNVVKLHTQDELDLVMSGSVGPNVPGSSANIGDISNYKGLVLEWRMNGGPEVFHQFIYLSDYDKDIILGNIPEPTDYPRRYTTILSDGFGTMMWLGVSLQGTQLYLSTNSVANPSPRLQRIYAIL